MKTVLKFTLSVLMLGADAIYYLMLFLAAVSIIAALTCCSAQSHNNQLKRVNAQRHGTKMFNHKVKQAATYRQKRKSVGL